MTSIKQFFTSKNLFDNIKTPIIVCVLVFITSIPFIDSNIIKYLPKLATDESLNYGGLIVKSLLVGIVFLIIQKFT